MARHATNAASALQALIGEDPTTSPWMEVDQDRVNSFADATLDHQFIHIDPEQAAATALGGTVAHGFLTLSLLPHLVAQAEPEGVSFDGIIMGINYGLNKVRFVNPILTGSRIRAHVAVTEVSQKDNAVDRIQNVSVEIEGESKPAMVAEWITRFVFA